MKQKKLKRDYSGYLYILPFFLLTAIFWFVPIFISGGFSLTEYNALTTPHFVGLENYKSLFLDKTFQKCIKNTLIFVITVVPAQTVLGLCIAVWVNKRRNTFLGKFVRNGMFIPSLAASSVISIVCRILLNNESSPLSGLLALFGINSTMILGSRVMVLPALIIIDTLMGLGYYMVLYLAYLVDIPDSYYEAAKLDGATDFQMMTKLTIPLMKPTIIMVVFLGVISTFQSFDLVYVMTGGGPGNATTMTVMVYLYLYSFKYAKIGYGMAIGNIMIVMVGLLTFLQRRLINNKETELY